MPTAISAYKVAEIPLVSKIPSTVNSVVLNPMALKTILSVKAVVLCLAVIATITSVLAQA